ncbi:TonB-dependent receptor [Methylomonas sp. AM2-LC]|uniref:TonB-dependent siderophore receptor n=1 Tax=Methylomonas sp. AM2-LC TaxID=3153301 RepID=UPI003267196A
MKSLDTGCRPYINLLLAAGLLTPMMTLAAEQAIIPFDIPAQSLAGALIRFSAATGLQVLYEGDIASQIKSPELKGRYTSEDALQKLLQGSGLNYRYSNSKTITLEKAVAPAVSPINQADPITLPKVNVVGNAVYDVKDPYNQDYVLPDANVGTKTDTPIMETPLNVQVVSKQVMKDQQAITLADALKNVSGVITNTTGGDGGDDTTTLGGTQTDITIRGFVSSTYLRNGFRLQQGNRTLANVESVEVLKGPAAILYGLVEPGGMVNVVTKQPLATPYYAFSQQFGTYDNYRTTADASGPIAGNKDVLYRMNMSYQNNGNWQDFVNNEDLFLAPVLKWNISPRTQATVEFEYNRNHQGVGGYVNPFINNQLLTVPLSRNYGEYSPVNTETFFGGLNWSHQFDDDWAIKHRFSVNQISNTANLFSSIGAYSPDILNAVTPLAYQPFSRFEVLRTTYSNATQNNTYSTNLDLTGHFDTFGLKHTLLLGGDYYRLNNTNRNDTSPLYTLIDPYNPVHPGQLPFIFGADNITGYQQRFDQYGLYGQDQIKLPYDVHVTGGIRYQYLHQNYIQTSQDVVSGTAASTQDAVTPRVGILWHPQNWVSLYANYAESFGANSGLVWSAQNSFTPVAATSASQYEGGIKTEFFDGRLRATLAYYDLTKTNVATGDPNLAHDCGNGPGSCSLAIGAVRSRGPELDIQGEILPGWNAIATYANVDIIITKTNSNNDPLGNINVGDRMVNVPRNTGSFWSTYEPKKIG